MGRDILGTLVFIPTYNERENVVPLLDAILAESLDCDILFMDDASPDGTGDVLDKLALEHPRVTVVHRPGKEGVGAAHQAGIRWAYERGYQRLVTMDADFAHPPQYLPALLAAAEGDADVVVGSRYLRAGSLGDWSLRRRVATVVGHALTRVLLGTPYDATGAFRLYHLTRVPPAAFGLVRSRDYSFFFESLFIIHANGFTVSQIPIHVAGRTFGTSKMQTRHVAGSVRMLLSLFVARLVNRRRIMLGARAAAR